MPAEEPSFRERREGNEFPHTKQLRAHLPVGFLPRTPIPELDKGGQRNQLGLAKSVCAKDAVNDGLKRIRLVAGQLTALVGK
jgi:hypothetical protein